MEHQQPASDRPDDAGADALNEATFTLVSDEKPATAQDRLRKIAERIASMGGRIKKAAAAYFDRVKGMAERMTGGGAKAFAGNDAAAKQPATDTGEPPIQEPKPPTANTDEPPIREPNAGKLHIEPGAGLKSVSWAGRAAIVLEQQTKAAAARDFKLPAAIPKLASLAKTVSAMLGDKQTFGKALRDRMPSAYNPTATKVAEPQQSSVPETNEPPKDATRSPWLSPWLSMRGSAGTAATPPASMAPRSSSATAGSTGGLGGQSTSRIESFLEQILSELKKRGSDKAADESEDSSQRRTQWNDCAKPAAKSMWSQIPVPPGGGGTYRQHL